MSQAIEFDVRLDAQQDIDVTMDATPQCRAELDAIRIGGGTTLDKTIEFKYNDEVMAVSSIKNGQTVPCPNLNISNVSAFGYTSQIGSGVYKSFPITPTQAKETVYYEAYPGDIVIVDLGNENPSLIRGGTNSLDWNFETVNVYNHPLRKSKEAMQMIKFPIHYRKIYKVVNNQITQFGISRIKHDSTWVPYPCFIDENGNELPYILIAQWYTGIAGYTEGSRTGLYCGQVKNVTSAPSFPVPTIRLALADAGTGFQSYDWQMHIFLRDLQLAYNLANNVLSKLHWPSAPFNLLKDWLKLYTTAMYCGALVDGMCGCKSEDGTERLYMFTDKPSKYSDDINYILSNYKKGPTINFDGAFTSYPRFAVNKLFYSEQEPFFNFPVEVSLRGDTPPTTYYCAFAGLACSRVEVRYFNHVVDFTSLRPQLYGAFCYPAWYVGAENYVTPWRLCFRPIAGYDPNIF